MVLREKRDDPKVPVLTNLQLSKYAIPDKFNKVRSYHHHPNHPN